MLAVFVISTMLLLMIRLFSKGSENECRYVHVCTRVFKTTLIAIAGQTLFNYCRGKDDRVIQSEKARKSVSAEVNYGIRFTQVDTHSLGVGQCHQNILLTQARK